MKLEQSFEVRAPLERVWEALIDLEHVAPCLPGAAVTGRNEDGSYSGVFTVKIGPTSASYAGTLTIDSINEQVHVASLHAHGHDRRGQGSAKATIFSTCSPTPDGGTRVEVITEYFITGRLARFGRGGMIEDISERLLRDFAARLQASLAEAPANEVPAVPGPPKGELAPWQRIAAAAVDLREAAPAPRQAGGASGPADPRWPAAAAPWDAAAGVEAPAAPAPEAPAASEEPATPEDPAGFDRSSSPEEPAAPKEPAEAPAAQEARLPPRQDNGDAPAAPGAAKPPPPKVWDQLRRNPGTAGFVAGVALALLARRRGNP